jgi:hypothetical protein
MEAKIPLSEKAGWFALLLVRALLRWSPDLTLIISALLFFSLWNWTFESGRTKQLCPHFHVMQTIEGGVALIGRFGGSRAFTNPMPAIEPSARCAGPEAEMRVFGQPGAENSQLSVKGKGAEFSQDCESSPTATRSPAL